MKFQVKKIREGRNLTRYRLAQLSGVKESTLQAIENSDNPNPTFRIMCQLADALGVSLDALRGEDERCK